jgi:hypothetical protein
MVYMAGHLLVAGITLICIKSILNDNIDEIYVLR